MVIASSAETARSHSGSGFAGSGTVDTAFKLLTKAFGGALLLLTMFHSIKSLKPSLAQGKVCTCVHPWQI